jgi:hypothetical protein
MTRQLITNSYYGQSNTSNKISAGVVDVNITDSINLKLNIDDIAVLNSVMGLDFIDFEEWKSLVVEYQQAMTNQKKVNHRKYVFYYHHNENFDFSTDPFNGEKEIFFSESKNAEKLFYESLQKNIVDTYFKSYNSLKKEEEVVQEQISKKTTITYFDKDTLEVDDNGILLSIIGGRLEDLLDALTQYLETYYQNTMDYIKKYVSKKNNVENIELAKVFDNNNGAIIEFGNKENIDVNDILELLKVFFPEYDIIE